MSAQDVAEQYATDRHLRARIQTHARYTAGPDLETEVDRQLALGGSEALLDAGSGPGDFPGRLRAAGHRGRLVGADLSAGMVERARMTHPQVEFVQAEASNLPFPTASFDVLTARHMLYHVPNIPAALAEFRRVLRPGGRFLAVTNASGYLAELWDLVAEAAHIEPSLIPLLNNRAEAMPFSEVDGEALVRAALDNAAVTFSDSALLFPEAAPVLAYLDSMPTLAAMPDPRPAHAALEQVLAPRLAAGPWRVSKRMAFISATRV